MYVYVSCLFFSSNPEWRSGMSDGTLLSEISGLSFDSRFLSSLSFFFIVFIFYLVIFC